MEEVSIAERGEGSPGANSFLIDHSVDYLATGGLEAHNAVKAVSQSRAQ